LIGQSTSGGNAGAGMIEPNNFFVGLISLVVLLSAFVAAVMYVRSVQRHD